MLWTWLLTYHSNILSYYNVFPNEFFFVKHCNSVFSWNYTEANLFSWTCTFILVIQTPFFSFKWVKRIVWDFQDLKQGLKDSTKILIQNSSYRIKFPFGKRENKKIFLRKSFDNFTLMYSQLVIKLVEMFWKPHKYGK